jgi:aminopeptidase N
MGRELFDYAFKTYANRWKFKHPTPEDFFRTMEDASAVDLDWFIRGWFYTTDYTDIGIKEVKKYFVSNNETKEVKEYLSKRRRRRSGTDGPMVYMVAEGSEDYTPNMNKPFNPKEITHLDAYIKSHFTPEEQAKLVVPKYFYQVTFDKPGGLVMPIIVALTFEDGTSENHVFPAQIWRLNDAEVSRTFATQKAITKIVVDPKLETADIDVTNNTWPKQEVQSKFD